MIEKFAGQNGFAIVPVAAITDSRLSATSIRVLAFLLSKTSEWRVIATQVGKALGLSERTARRALEDLETCGYARPVFSGEGGSRHRTDTVINATPIRSEMTAPKPIRTKVTGSPRTETTGSTSQVHHPVKNVRIDQQNPPDSTSIRTNLSADPVIFVQDPGQICPDTPGQKCPPTQEETQEELLSNTYSGEEDTKTSYSWTRAEIDAMSKEEADRLMGENSTRGAAFATAYYNRMNLPDLNHRDAAPRKIKVFTGAGGMAELLQRARSAA